MKLRLDLEGMKVQLNIKEYKKYDPEKEFSNWCKVDYSFFFQNCINYSKEDVEVLTSIEVDKLKRGLDDFINNKIKSECELSFDAPDFEFGFIPSYNLLESERVIYVKTGFEMSPPVIEWKIYLWHEGLTDTYFSTSLDIDEAIVLRDYLMFVTGDLEISSKTIQGHIAKGFITD